MRKKKQPESKDYPAPYSIRFTKEERTLLEKLRNGVPLAKFIKNVLFSGTLRLPKLRKLSFEDQKLIAQENVRSFNHHSREPASCP